MEKMNSEPDFRRVATKVVVDVVCLLSVGVPIYIFYLSGKPYERGFFCDDESLRHPYHDSTVPSWILYIVGLGLPIVIIMITEYLNYAWISDIKVKYRVLSMRVPSWCWESYRHIGVFGFGAACSQLTTDVAKYTIGRLRPHFFDVCKPKIDCNDPKYKNVYIEKFTCAQQSEKLLKDMRLSFPSGHSSFSAYCMLFLVMYLQAKMTWKGSKLLKHVLQYICIMMAFYTALTRISDYKHHWSDVLAGVIQGCIVAILIVVYVSDILEKPNESIVTESTATDGIRMENAMRMGLGSGDIIITTSALGYMNFNVFFFALFLIHVWWISTMGFLLRLHTPSVKPPTETIKENVAQLLGQWDSNIGHELAASLNALKIGPLLDAESNS